VYQSELIKHLNLLPHSIITTNDKLLHLIGSIHQATKTAVPSKIIRLKGPKRKASPMVSKLIGISKNKHRIWNNAGRPKNGHTLFSEKKQAKRKLRQQQRKEIAIEKEKFVENLEKNPNDQIFYQLIRRNQNGRKIPDIDSLKMEDIEAFTPKEQCELLAKYYEDLAQPKTSQNFNEEQLYNSKRRCDLIKNIAENSIRDEIVITEIEIKKAINELKNKKAPDEYGIAAEHLKLSDNCLLAPIADIFNQIFREEKIPVIFKTGTVIPILKKGKDSHKTENYRGITITSIIGKLFEYIILDKANLTKLDQSDLQFGFTQGLSPGMAALILSEVFSEITGKQILFVTTLDSQKAFDVVNHNILMDRLYHYGVDLKFWNIIDDLYDELTSTVKWKGKISLSFRINQGVRQGGVLSSHLYKAYINELLMELKNRDLGVSIGTTYAGCPTCADDVVLLSLDRTEMQEMLDIVYEYSSDHRFNIHPVKSNTILKSTKGVKEDHQNHDFQLGNSKLPCSDRTTHLGLTRTSKDENRINIDERISLARRTLYSLIKSGVHGSNGLNPKTSCRIYQVYIIPRLLYGLETLNISNKDMMLLCSFHLDTLRKIQSLPTRTASSAVYLLLGALPIRAELHKRQISLLFSIANSKNESMKTIALRQHISGRPSSFFVKIADTLELYNLPNIDQLFQQHYKKEDWKLLVKKAINQYWTSKLKLDCKEKSSLLYMCKENLKIGSNHVVWSSVSPSVSDIRKAITKCRMLTGTYILQIHKHKFNQAEVDPTCPFCRTENEDLCHLLTACPHYADIRKRHYFPIKEFIQENIGHLKWKELFSNTKAICQLLMDCQILAFQGVIPNNSEFIYKVEKMSRDLCFEIHKKRLSS